MDPQKRLGKAVSIRHVLSIPEVRAWAGTSGRFLLWKRRSLPVELLVRLFSCVCRAKGSGSAVRALLAFHRSVWICSCSVSPNSSGVWKRNAVWLSLVCFEGNICLRGLLSKLADGSLAVLGPTGVLVLCIRLRLRKPPQSTYQAVSKAVVAVALWEHKWSSRDRFEKVLHRFGG